MASRRAITKKASLLTGFTALALAGCVSTSPVDEPSQSAAKNAFAWLAGCWASAAGTEEFWQLTKHGDQLFGYSVSVNDGQRVFFEAMRLDTNGDTATFYAYPQGEGPTGFAGKLIDEATAEFTNPENDYPQRIRYQLVDDELVGTISLIDNSNQNEWRYSRCDR